MGPDKWVHIGKPLINFISASHTVGSDLEMNSIVPMYKINQYPGAGLSLPNKTETICCCKTLLITKRHKARGGWKNKEPMLSTWQLILYCFPVLQLKAVHDGHVACWVGDWLHVHTYHVLFNLFQNIII